MRPCGNISLVFSFLSHLPHRLCYSTLNPLRAFLSLRNQSWKPLNSDSFFSAFLQVSLNRTQILRHFTLELFFFVLFHLAFLLSLFLFWLYVLFQLLFLFNIEVFLTLFIILKLRTLKNFLGYLRWTLCEGLNRVLMRF